MLIILLERIRSEFRRRPRHMIKSFCNRQVAPYGKHGHLHLFSFYYIRTFLSLDKNDNLFLML